MTWTDEAEQILRLVIRLGGRSGDAAKHIGCTKYAAARKALRLGLRFSDVRRGA